MFRAGLSRCGYETARKSKFGKLYTVKGVKQYWELIPLILLQTCAFFGMPFMAYHRMFVTTIDVQLTDYQRFEIPSVPKFYDLRNPRTLKLIEFTKWEPAIHLDNRYRLMRHEPMLDADGNKTHEIGSDH
ncbi:uncharacterized protein LOC105193822 isoform X2 [Solenopsis invicta]|nr:uncharacterized protein LOC105193822 isoform X2 [Solenopsis invicta]